MSKLVMIAKRPANQLPHWTEPKNVRHAGVQICEWGKNMHEHAYLVGRTLLWVKKEVGHGNFLKWLKDNVWFGNDTARRMMQFAARCDKAGETIEYHPRKNRTVRNLPAKSSPRDIGQTFGHRIRTMMEKLTPTQRRDAIFWIQAALDEYKEK
jgi:hypothetical protein